MSVTAPDNRTGFDLKWFFNAQKMIATQWKPPPFPTLTHSFYLNSFSLFFPFVYYFDIKCHRCLWCTAVFVLFFLPVILSLFQMCRCPCLLIMPNSLEWIINFCFKSQFFFVQSILIINGLFADHVTNLTAHYNQLSIQHRKNIYTHVYTLLCTNTPHPPLPPFCALIVVRLGCIHSHLPDIIG